MNLCSARRCVLLLVVLILVSPAGLLAQQQGKVSGTVVDAATGEGIPGVSVYVEENTYLGTITDENGRYFLLSVPPGTYNIVMSFIGYATLKHEGVQVFSGRTTTLDGQLREEVVEGEEVVVTADRPIVVRDRTTTVSFVDQETIDRLPVQEVSDLVRFQPGVVADAGGGFHFRGGRTRETAYIIDGIPVQDVFFQGGGNTVDIEVQSVQELQVYTGTFDAEFGGAQSGIVSVTTRDPGQKIQGSLRVQGGGYFAGTEDVFLGGDTFDPVGTKDFTLTLSGPIVPSWKKVGFFFTGRFEDAVGPFRGERRFTPEDGARIEAYRRWYRDIYQPDDTRFIALDTARTPGGSFIRGRDGQPITFASGDGDLVNMDWNRAWTLNPKFVFRPSSRSRLAVTGLYNQRESQGYSDGLRYAPDARSTRYERDFTGILNFQQTFGDNKVFSMRGSYKTGEIEAYAFDSIDDPGLQYLGAVDDGTGFSLGTTDNGKSRRTEQQLIVNSDFLWQINEWNEAKVGFQYRNNTFVIEDLDRNWVFADNPDSLFVTFPWPVADRFATFDDYYDEVQRRQPILVPELARFAVDDRFDQSPIELAVFAQDKFEFDSRLVVKAGVRYELYDVREKRMIDPRTPTDRIGREDNFEDTPVRQYVSPRLGISYPISSRGAFRVAYGHFVQMPAYFEILKNPIFSGINVGRLENRDVGNPDLDPERTIKYEMGLQQQLTDFIGVDLNLYYKNVRNLLGRELIGTLDNVLYTRTVNRDYALIRGGTLSIVTRPVGMLLGSSFDITYQDARGSSSNPTDVANTVTAGRSGEVGDFFLERSIIPLDWDQTFTVNLSANFGRPGDWSAGFIGQLATGQPYTPGFLDPNKNFPDNEFTNAESKPTLVSLDLNAEKRFQVGGVAYGLRVQALNVVNYLNEWTVNGISGRSGQIVRLPVEQADRDEVINYVGLFNTADPDRNPHWYSAPRQILLALTVNF